MKIDILTLFPDMFKGPFDESIIKRAVDEKLVEINIHNLRDWTTDKHRTVDDHPYGGGPGMIMMIEPIYKALNNLKNKKAGKERVVLTSAKGDKFTQRKAQEFSKLNHLILVAGHYEGVDERIAQHLVDQEISIGDYVLTGGELPSMVIVDTVVRLIPGVLGNPESLVSESFSMKEHSTEYPQYTRPPDFKGWKVPDVLLSGNHADIEKWKEKMSNKRR